MTPHPSHHQHICQTLYSIAPRFSLRVRTSHGAPSSCPSQQRYISSTRPLLSKQKRTLPLRNLPNGTPQPPPYPYHQAQRLYKQHLTGLYGGSIIHFGNRVSERNEIKTRRTWEPNSMHKRLYSLTLGRFIRVKITTAVMKTVEKCGGIDNYLLGTKPARLRELGDEGWRLRWMLLQHLRTKNDPRVTTNPVLRKEIELGDAAAAVRGEIVSFPNVSTVDVAVPTTIQPDDRYVDEDVDVEATIRQRLREDRMMREEQDSAPPSFWQRVGNAIHAPVKWSNAAARKLFRR